MGRFDFFLYREELSSFNGKANRTQSHFTKWQSGTEDQSKCSANARQFLGIQYIRLESEQNSNYLAVYPLLLISIFSQYKFLCHIVLSYFNTSHTGTRTDVNSKTGRAIERLQHSTEQEYVPSLVGGGRRTKMDGPDLQMRMGIV